MPEQFSFPGFEEPAPAPLAAAKGKTSAPAVPKGERAPYSLFFSIFPGEADAEALAHLAGTLRTEHGLTGKPLLPHRLHVTLHDLGGYTELPQEIVSAAMRAGDALAFDAFEVVFDSALSYPSSGTYVLSGDAGTYQLVAFHQALGDAMRDQGLRVKRGFTPHMTLVYDRHPVAKHPIEPMRWVAQEFVLIKSHVGKGLYDLLGRWPLQV